MTILTGGTNFRRASEQAQGGTARRGHESLVPKRISEE